MQCFGENARTAMAAIACAGVLTLSAAGQSEIDHTIANVDDFDLWPFEAVGDLNRDHVVMFDLLLVIGDWGRCGDPDDCPPDLDGDGVMDVFDLLIHIGNWDRSHPRAIATCGCASFCAYQHDSSLARKKRQHP